MNNFCFVEIWLPLVSSSFCRLRHQTTLNYSIVKKGFAVLYIMLFSLLTFDLHCANCECCNWWQTKKNMCARTLFIATEIFKLKSHSKLMTLNGFQIHFSYTRRETECRLHWAFHAMQSHSAILFSAIFTLTHTHIFYVQFLSYTQTYIYLHLQWLHGYTPAN